MKYDDMSWHIEGEFPDNISTSAAATHIGFFTVWAWINGLGGESLLESFDEISEILNQKKMSPGQIIIRYCDGKLTDEDLNDEGNRFALAYYEDNETGYGDDYTKTLTSHLSSFYHVSDNWDNYEIIKNVIDNKFEKWKKLTENIKL
jgi:hypothetical protein